MLTCGELARFLAVSAARAKSEITPRTQKFLDVVAKDAQAMIGQERSEWPPLAASTIKEKERLGYTGQVSPTDPLLRKGNLRRSIKATAESTGSGAQGVVGSDDRVAAYQEMGTSRIPPRPFLSSAIAQSTKKADKAFGDFGVELLVPGIR